MPPAMGQSVTVVAKPSSNPEVLRYEINRSLTGQGHERYRSLDDIVHDRPVDVLARRLLEAGGIDSVHVNSSMITVRLAGGSTGEGLLDIIENLFRFYGDEPAAPEAEPEPEPAESESEPAEAQAEPEAAAPEAEAAPEPEPEPEAAAEPEPEADEAPA